MFLLRAQFLNLFLSPLFKIIGGPQICMRLCAHVTVPELEISTDCVEFGPVQCGQCKVITVQLHNHKEVRCEWTSLNPADKKGKVKAFGCIYRFLC